MPDATTLALGQAFSITNRSTGNVTVNDNSGGLIQSMAANTQVIVTVTSISTTAGIWDSAYSSATALSNPMTALGDTIYGGTGGVPTDLPGNTTATKNFLTQTGTGSVSAAPAWGTIANSDLPAKNIAISSSSGTFVNGTALYENTGISATVVTAGRPVMIVLIPDGSANNSELVSDAGGSANVWFVRNGTNIAQFYCNDSATTYLPGGFVFIDPVGAGTYTYQLFSQNITANFHILFIKIAAWEM